MPGDPGDGHLTAACTGFLYALSVGDQFIRTQTARNVLVIGTDVLSRTIDLTDRNSCILFGDGAGAAVLSAADSPDHGIRSIKLYADGERRPTHPPSSESDGPASAERETA